MEATSRFLKGGIALLAAGAQERMQIRELSKADYGGLLDAHLILISLLSHIAHRYNLRPGKTSDSISDRLSLYASFIQGLDLAETAISEGLYAQATTLIKQQMETVAAMSEHVTSERKDGRTPNVKHLFGKMAVHYGHINDLVHVANRSVLRDFFQANRVGEAVPASITPRYNKNAARYLHTLEVALLLQFVIAAGELMEDMYGESWTDEEERYIVQAFRLLESEGAFDNAEKSKRT